MITIYYDDGSIMHDFTPIGQLIQLEFKIKF